MTTEAIEEWKLIDILGTALRLSASWKQDRAISSWKLEKSGSDTLLETGAKNLEEKNAITYEAREVATSATLTYLY